MKKEVLRMQRVTYVENDITILDNLNLQIYAGEVMGLLPLDSFGLNKMLELMQKNLPILYGQIYIREKLVNSFSIGTETENNVLMISYENILVKYLSPEENIFILRKGYKGIWINNRIIKSQMKMLTDELKIGVQFNKSLEEMSVFERYILEILKAVVSRADVIILRDPSSVITPDQMDRLYQVVRYYAGKGNTFLYVSTRQDELCAMCDRTAIMETGRIVKILEKRNLTERVLRNYMLSYQGMIKRSAQVEDSPDVERIFRFKDYSYNKIKELSFSIRRGECLVIHDGGEQIYDDLEYAFTEGRGDSGQLLYRGKPYRKKDARKIAVVLDNPAENMLFKNMSYEDNLCLTSDHLLKGLWHRKETRKAIARERMGEKMPQNGTEVKNMTIYQKYRLIYGRILLQHPDIVVCIHPFLNTDLKLRTLIYQLMKELLDHGIAVVIVTVNYQNVLLLADRLVFVKDGKNIGILNRKEFEYLLSET